MFLNVLDFPGAVGTDPSGRATRGLKHLMLWMELGPADIDRDADLSEQQFGLRTGSAEALEG
jgi:hypothetical protein